jgi:hypothetical protein
MPPPEVTTATSSLWLAKPGRKSVLVSTDLVTRIDSPAKEIHVKVTRREIEQSPSVENADIELIETTTPFLIF